MFPFLITVTAVLATIFLVGVILFVIALVIKKIGFGSRCDKNPLLTYFTAEDFNLSAKQVDISCVKNQYIRGIIYKKEGVEPKKELIIFCHGMGPGHVAYTTEIAYFCNLGYMVLAPDYAGCNISDGKSIKGFKNGVDAVSAAIYYARENLAYYKIYLVGHSWGAYSALCAAERTGEVNGVVAISAPDKPEKVIYKTVSEQMSPFLAKLLYPFISAVCGGDSAAEAAVHISAPVLLIHGDSDKVVPMNISAYGNADGENITKYLAENKRHNPYNTVEAEDKLAELSENLAKFKLEEVKEEYFKTFDYKAATEEDIEVMEQIAQFLSKI